MAATEAPLITDTYRRLWQLGVAYPLKNHKFRYPTVHESTIQGISATDSSPAAGGIAVNVNTPYLQFEKIFQKGDIFRIKNSSGQADNLIIHRIRQVGMASLVGLDLVAAPTFSYSSGDDFIGLGTRLAGGWERSSGSSEDVIIEPYGIKPAAGGASDNFAQRLRTGVSQIDSHYIYQDLDSYLLEPFTYYRYGFSFKTDLDSVGGLPFTFTELRSVEGSTGVIPFAIVDSLAWKVLLLDSVFSRATAAVENFGAAIFTPQLRIGLNPGGGGRIHLVVDDIFLEHARDTTSKAILKSSTNVGGSVWNFQLYESSESGFDFTVAVGDEVSVTDGILWARFSVLSAAGTVIQVNKIAGSDSAIVNHESEVQVKNDGVYTFPIYPNFNSLVSEKSHQIMSVPIPGAGAKAFTQTGENGERWFLRSHFFAASQAFRKALKVFESWQERGYMLALHTYLPELPSVMIGKMRIIDRTKSIPTLDYFDFDFEFEEMVL